MTLTFAELHARFPDAPGPLLAAAFDTLPEREQQECWAELAEQCDRRIDAKHVGEQRLPKRQAPRSTKAARRPASAARSDDPLRAVAADEYVEALTGVAITGRTIRCPLPGHDERTPSFHLYDDGGFYCFGCGRGGSYIDFCTAWYDLEPRGAGYHEIRRRFAADLGLRLGDGQ